MSSFNKVILLGNLTRDPEVRYTPNDAMPVASFSLAVNSFAGTGENRKQKVDYIDIVVFGKQAENCGKYVFKGNSVLIEGKFRQQRWDDKDTGAKRSKIEVIADRVVFMPKTEKQPGIAGPIGEVFPGAAPVDDGEIPF